MIHSVINQSPYDSFIKWRLTDACNYRCSYCGRLPVTKRMGYDTVPEAQLKGLEAAPDISRICDELPGKVQLDLVGGEVTLLNLFPILDRITSCKLKSLSLTTNFSAPLSYYIALVDYLGRRNIVLTLTASYHAEHVDMQQFLSKASAFIEVKGPHTVFKVETVSTLYNQERVKLFQQACERLNIPYMIDSDFRTHNDTLLVATSEQKPVRYEIVLTDGRSMLYRSRSRFLQDYGKTSYGITCVDTQGMYCTRDWNFVYVDKDQVMGHGHENGYCKDRVPLSQYHPLKEPALCKRTECSICGLMSLSRDQQLLIKRLTPKEE